MVLLVRYDTPMFLIAKGKYDEAKKAINWMFKGDHDRIFEYLKKNTSRDTDNTSFKDALCGEKYKTGTLVTISFAFAMFVNGIFPISS